MLSAGMQRMCGSRSKHIWCTPQLKHLKRAGTGPTTKDTSVRCSAACCVAACIRMRVMMRMGVDVVCSERAGFVVQSVPIVTIYVHQALSMGV